jgi:hypothetical protein
MFAVNGILKDRLVGALRDFWSYEDRQSDLVIQNRFSFRERPQKSIVVKSSGGSFETLSADNFMGHVDSYTFMMKFQQKQGLFLEWVREDSVAIQNNRGVFPSLPGIYAVCLEKVDPNDPDTEYQFYVDPIFSVYDEELVRIDNFRFSFQNAPHEGSDFLQEFTTHSTDEYPFSDSDYTISGNIVTFKSEIRSDRRIKATYRYQGTVSKTYPVLENHANTTAIPGVTLAFGQNFSDGDVVLVVVQPERVPSYEVYGGFSPFSYDVEIYARDDREYDYIAQKTMTFLFGVLRSRWSTEGIEILDISHSGDIEEMYDDTGDDYYYGTTLTLNIRTNWEIHVPVPVTLRSLTSTIASATSVVPAPIVGQRKFERIK